MNETSLLKRLGVKLTSRKLWGFLITIALVVFIGYVGGWALAVDLGKIVVPVALAVLTGGIAYEKRYAGEIPDSMGEAIVDAVGGIAPPPNPGGGFGDGRTH